MLSEKDLMTLLPFAGFIDGNDFAGSRVRRASCLQDVEAIAHLYGHNQISCQLLGSVACYLYSCEWIWQDIEGNWNDHAYMLALAIKIQKLIPAKDRMSLSQRLAPGSDNSDGNDWDNHELDIARQEMNLLKASSEFAKNSEKIKSLFTMNLLRLK
jgi:hypothetical protein